MRAAPYFEWDFVYTMIERECRAQAAPAGSSWWAFPESEAEDELEQEDDQAAELSESEWEEWEQDEPEEYATETESEGPVDEAYDESGLVDESGKALEVEHEAEDEAESVFLEPLRVAMAVARGERDEKKLTNDVFFARYPERGRRAIAPDEKDLAAVWIGIRDRLVRPLLARAAKPTASGGSA